MQVRIFVNGVWDSGHRFQWSFLEVENAEVIQAHIQRIIERFAAQGDIVRSWAIVSVDGVL